MNRACGHNRGITAVVCQVFIWPFMLALVNYYFVRFLSGYILCALYYACLFLMYLCYGEFRINLTRDMGCMLTFLLTYGVVTLLSGEYVLQYSFLFSLAIYLFCAKYVEVEEPVFKKAFLWFVGISTFVTMLLTIRTLVQYPGAARVLASSSFAQYGLELYRKMGTGGFEFIYSLVVLAPVGMVASIKMHGILRMVAISFSVVMITTILFSGYTTAILLLILTCALIICSINKGTMWMTIILSPLLIYGFMYFRDAIANQIYELAGMFSAKAVANHLIELADVIAQKTDIEDLDRMAHYAKSVDAFLKKPLTGVYISEGASAVSGHSTLLDLLGGGGLLCFIPYCLFLVSWYLRVAHMLRDRWTKTGWNIASIVYVALQLVNPIFSNYMIIFAYMAIAVVVLKECDRLITGRSIFVYAQVGK